MGRHLLSDYSAMLVSAGKRVTFFVRMSIGITYVGKPFSNTFQTLKYVWPLPQQLLFLGIYPTETRYWHDSAKHTGTPGCGKYVSFGSYHLALFSVDIMLWGGILK